MIKLMPLAAALVCYLLAVSVSEYIFYCILISEDPLATPNSFPPQWEMCLLAPLICPVRYTFVAYSTIAGGRESFAQRMYAVPFAVLIVTFLVSYLVWVILVLLFDKNKPAASSGG